ncbi:hypothetical protein [Sphingobacterium lumbrici]|uniref:hypothetical protein n=1 Tax=Sphingobacterium lumbrici TaxID=2559600 RepID=UPI001128915C|nr:hypothetical protein [Sphingobacterium lumbrici]
MKGFEITINDTLINVGVDKGMILVILHNDLKGGISVSGIDDSSGRNLDWGRIQLKVGDKIKITTCDIDSRAKIEKEEIRSKSALLMEYNGIKEYLVKEGLLDDSI